MNHTKYRIWLISIVLAAAVFGMIWYFSGKEEEKTITDGTLVYYEDRGMMTAQEAREVQEIQEVQEGAAEDGWLDEEFL